MALKIARVLALPDPLVVNTIYLVAVSATELQVVVVGDNVANVRKTILTSDVDGKIVTALATAAVDAAAKADAAQAAAIAAAAADATAKASAAQAAAIAAAALDATTKATAAQADAIAAAALDATTKADAAQAAAIAAAAADALAKESAAQAAAIAAAAADATAKANDAQAAAILAAAGDATTKAGAALTDAKAYTDTTVTNAIGGLDMSNTAILVTDIAERDALTLTKNSFVVVADATADPTVNAGAAMYFYNKSDDSFMKIAEYESMDLVIPNKAILEDLSDESGILHYKGEPIGTVVAGSNEW